MAKLPELPAWLKPFTAEELEQEEQRQRLQAVQAEARQRRQQQRDWHDARDQKVKKRPARFARIEAGYKQRGDPLIKFGKIVENLVASVPGLTEAMVRQRFLDTVERGDFPLLGSGFRREPDRRAVNALIDFHSEKVFVPGQYPLRPGTLTIKAAPLEMRARTSVWPQWIKAQGWPVSPELGCRQSIIGPTTGENSPVGQAQATDPLSPAPGEPRNQQRLPSRRGNTPYNDAAIVAQARAIYRGMAKPTKTKAAKAAVEKFKQDNPKAQPQAITEKAWIDRISRQI
jgi:hypothetical protein